MSEIPFRTSEASDSVVSKAVVNRLSLYLREILYLLREGHETVSSTVVGSRLGISDAQVRKDLANFGQFGHPGIGYHSAELVARIRQILGTDRQWRVGLVGLGNLGRALLRHRGFADQGFQIVAAFDSDRAKLNGRFEGIATYPAEGMEDTIRRLGIRLGIMAVPSAEAQSVAGVLVRAGVEGIMNFAPVNVIVPPGVSKVEIDLAIELEQLSFAVVNRGETA
jgi:redox-sensing transcriptional repressor